MNEVLRLTRMLSRKVTGYFQNLTGEEKGRPKIRTEQPGGLFTLMAPIISRQTVRTFCQVGDEALDGPQGSHFDTSSSSCNKKEKDKHAIIQKGNS